MRRLFTNNAISTLASGINSTVTSLSLTSGGGALFPNPNAGNDQAFNATLVKNGNTAIYEIVQVLVRSTDTFATIVRGQEGTTALSWNAGDFVYLFQTADDNKQFVQFDDMQLNATNYALDTGTANAYSFVPSPALLTRTAGMQFRVKMANANTSSTCTINDGLGVVAMSLQDATTVPIGQIGSNTIVTVIWDGSRYRLQQQDLSSFLTAAVAASTYAAITNAHLFGIPTAPTAAPGTVTTQLATCDFATDAGEVTFSGGPGSGSAIWPGGLIENWGLIATPGSSPTNIVFDTPYSTTVYCIQATCINSFQELFVNYSSSYGSLSQFSLSFAISGQLVAWRALGF